MTCEDMQCPTLNCDDDEIVSYKPDKCCGFCNDNWVIVSFMLNLLSEILNDVDYNRFSIDPVSKGLVTPPLGVEKLSPRLKIKLFA